MPASETAGPPIWRFQHTAMAAQFEIRCSHPDEPYARQAARFAFAIVDRLEQQLSRFVENSDIAAINRLAAGEHARVGFETLDCLQVARLIWQQTDGAFDPSIGSGFADLELLSGDFIVRRGAAREREEAPGGVTISLNLGAIGKGYAVDRMAEALEDWDVARALIDAGYSSVAALEPPAGRDGWPLTLTAPVRPFDTSKPGAPAGEVFARLVARQQALGASGIQKGDHIRDPRDGSPVRKRLGAWVSAPRQVLAAISEQAGAQPSATAVADALSTAFMIMSPDAIARYCSAHAGVEAWIVEDGIRYFPGV